MNEEELINVGKTMCEMQSKINALEKENVVLKLQNKKLNELLDAAKRVFDNIERMTRFYQW